MPKGDVETYYLGDRWRNRIEAGRELPGEYQTKQLAVDIGRDEARRRQVAHIIRDLDGRVGEHNSYGNDPQYVPG